MLLLAGLSGFSKEFFQQHQLEPNGDLLALRMTWKLDNPASDDDNQLFKDLDPLQHETGNLGIKDPS